MTNKRPSIFDVPPWQLWLYGLGFHLSAMLGRYIYITIINSN